MSRITAVQEGTNGQLIATAQTLYPMDGLVLDLTPGTELGFWTQFQPTSLLLFNPPGGDFRLTGFEDGKWDHVVFDPPYVTKGGHKTSTIGEMNDRYGMLHVEKTPMLQWERQIIPGVEEARRLLKPKGLLWFKCMSYVTSGKIWWFDKMAVPMLEGLGFRVEDEFILSGHAGPQPLTDKCKACCGVGHYAPGAPSISQRAYGEECVICRGTGRVPRPQKHAARAHSHLFIARKRSWRKP